ncbi:MAG: ATP-binding protein [Pseudomonadota bacterium]
MRLSLRRQLALIGLAALALPWLATNYIRESELALRDAQETFLQRLAEGIANNLTTDFGPNIGELYVYPLQREPVLDGFIDDWLLPSGAIDATQVTRGEWRVIVGEYGAGLWLQIDATHSGSAMPSYSLSCANAANGETRFEFTPEAPGNVLTSATNSASRLRGYWLPNGEGSRLEARLPMVDCDRAISIGFEALSSATATALVLIRQDQQATADLTRNAAPGIEQYMINRDGWRMTPIIGNASMTADTPIRESVGTQLYRRIIGNARPTLTIDDGIPRLTNAPYTRALNGETVGFRALASETSDTVVAVAVVPVGQSNALVVRQNSAEILSLNNPSVMKLTYRTLMITAGVVVLLLAWATWISFRVRRLANTAKSALNSRGELSTTLPGAGARDEIGELARDFTTLLEQVNEQQQWLRSLADKLSHELRTPMAVVRSSLENLEQSDLDETQQRIHGRAASGIDRLHNMLNAMSQANRAEQVVNAAELEYVDLSNLLSQLSGAYKSTFPDHQWHTDISPNLSVRGNADLLVQLLDKLVENAASFSPVGARIVLRLKRQENGALIELENHDASLPPGDPDRLFKTFVSERHPSTGDGTHLGFGLYIAALITKAHGGTITASDVASDTHRGVRISIHLPGKH